MAESSLASVRCGIILAGGDGERLRPFVPEAAPVLSCAFGRIRMAVGTTAERAVTEEVYAGSSR